MKMSNKRKSISKISAMGGDSSQDNRYYYGGRLVDENMIVLRKRIHETKMIERNYEPPSDWMDWEKKYYTSYDANICSVVGVLQDKLMNMRPSVALGTIAIVTLSVPVSTAMIGFHLFQIVHTVLSAGVH
ncbi:hypothetical protein C5167_023103 [Papaver somniferum]|uniref:Uncharacterized protein n=2 Tax=Papaver somniferum TaxID=3469 RepID=A0A4Y7JMZ4_PAPSO|nr:hypothetical protein C5167_023103 [Papaver somniferum]